MGDKFENISKAVIYNNSNNGHDVESKPSSLMQEVWYKRPVGLVVIGVVIVVVGGYIVHLLGWSINA